MEFSKLTVINHDPEYKIKWIKVRSKNYVYEEDSNNSQEGNYIPEALSNNNPVKDMNDKDE